MYAICARYAQFNAASLPENKFKDPLEGIVNEASQAHIITVDVAVVVVVVGVAAVVVVVVVVGVAAVVVGVVLLHFSKQSQSITHINSSVSIKIR